MAAAQTAPATAQKRPRDPRLDFFRGLAMFIILLAHTPMNSWTLWIPARFGFSDATEIFVFCSGMASALAFGTVFRERGWGMGVARVAFRVWQVYWAHVGVFLFTVALLAFADLRGWGGEDVTHIARPYVVPFFEDTQRYLVGLLTLSYVPGLFDILPMYLAILALIPVVIGAHRLGGLPAAAGLSVGLWLAATLAGLAWTGDWAPLDALGAPFLALNLPGSPAGDATWFFNPFAWQLVFFTGFAFGMGWLPAPPVSRRLIGAAVAFLLLSIPFAWYKIHQGFYLPDAWLLQDWIEDARAAMRPLWTKTWQGLFRYLHFLALAYLAWVAVGPRGARLSEGFRGAPIPLDVRRRRALIAAAVAIPTIPYSYVPEIKALAPALDAWVLATLPVHPALSALSLVHLAALCVLVWSLMSDAARAWLVGPALVAAVPVIRKVGTQSLAVFMVSIPLSRVMGFAYDAWGATVFTRPVVNLSGFAVLIATAYFCSWIKAHPWRRPAPAPASGGATATAERSA